MVENNFPTTVEELDLNNEPQSQVSEKDRYMIVLKWLLNLLVE